MKRILRGKRILLRPLDKRDLPKRAEWTRDPELARLMSGPGDGVDVAERSLAGEIEANRQWLAGRGKMGVTPYAIEVDGTYIGDVDYDVFPAERKAELTLFIGDRSAWRKGYGTEAATLIIEELFRDELVEVIEADVAAGNDRALAFWKKMGFVEDRVEQGGRWLRLVRGAWKASRLSGKRQRGTEMKKRKESSHGGDDALNGQMGPFVPIRDEDGNVTGMMDPLVAEYLSSDRPDPQQADLDELFGKVDAIRLLAGGVVRDKPLGTEVLLEVTERSDIDELHRCLRIKKDPLGHCMCLGDQAFEFLNGAERIAVIGLHHGTSIRWNRWRNDAELEDGRKLLTWLASKGVEGPLRAYEADRKRAEESMRVEERWKRETPPCLLLFWEIMNGFDFFEPENRDSIRNALRDGIPDEEERILELFRWFGCGKGPWSGFPSYETVPGTLLFDYPTERLAEVLQKHPLCEQHLEGAARFFAGWDFSKKRGNDLKAIPPVLRKILLNHSLESEHAGNVWRAKRAFGEDS